MDIHGSEFYQVHDQEDINTAVEEFRLILQEALTVERFDYELELSFSAQGFRK